MGFIALLFKIYYFLFKKSLYLNSSVSVHIFVKSLIVFILEFVFEVVNEL